MNFLDDDELTEYTGYKQFAKRTHSLTEMGVAFKVNPRGRILVSRDVLGQPKRKVRAEPDWSAIKHKAA